MIGTQATKSAQTVITWLRQRLQHFDTGCVFTHQVAEGVLGMCAAIGMENLKHCMDELAIGIPVWQMNTSVVSFFFSPVLADVLDTFLKHVFEVLDDN